jgi:formate hydrogenlyase subunit 3/multisubunit Na+/H+ antiporter MnhD subunit
MLGFFVGGMAICAMPPTNGFASKWLIYQGYFQLSFAQVPLVDRAIAMAVIGSLAFVGALSLACYAKAIGIAFLGRGPLHCRQSSRRRSQR